MIACSVIASSVIGAAHRRQGRPCQDAALSRELLSPRGERLLLLAVADGHGGSRYWLSHVGSQLACELAATAVAAALADHELGAVERWRQLLASDLPAAIQHQWLEAIEADWRQRPEAGGEAFAPLTYGSTLGLALLAPGWWGCTGLGDWDLVRLERSGAELVSEETALEGPGEATASLCLADALGRWHERSRLVPLTPATEPFSLLLSSDGIRKSCATDADFLSLSGHLAALIDGDALAGALAEITAAGSGDDVSVAIGHWGAGPVADPPAPPTAPGRRPRPAARIAGATALLGLAGVAAALAVGWHLLRSRQAQRPAPTPPQRLRPSPSPKLDAASRASLARESQRLCRQPGTIAATLTQRKPQFRALLDGQRQVAELLAGASRDPLGALIAASYRAPGAAPAAAPALLGGSCVELRQALEQQWRLQRLASGRMPPAPTPAPVPPPRP